MCYCDTNLKEPSDEWFYKLFFVLIYFTYSELKSLWNFNASSGSYTLEMDISLKLFSISASFTE